MNRTDYREFLVIYECFEEIVALSIRQKYAELSPVAKAAIWFTFCNFLLKGIGFISGPIFTRLISTDEYGKLSVFMSYEQLFLILATWEIQLGAYQKGLYKFSEDVRGFTCASQALVNIFTVIFFTMVFLFNKVITKLTEIPFELLVLMFASMLIIPSYTAWLGLKKKNYEYKKVVASTIIYSICNVLFAVIAVLSIDRTADIKYGSTLIFSIIFGLFFYFKHLDYRKLFVDFTKTREYWKFCIKFEGPAVFHSLSFLILAQADRVMIKGMIGATESALYSVAYTVASAISVFQASITSSLVHWRYQKLEIKDYESIRKTTGSLLLGIAGIIFVFILVVPELFFLVFPADYHEAVWCIPPISMGVYFMFLYSILVNIEEYYEKTQYVAYVAVTCGVIKVSLNYFGIQMFGYIACAYTTLISYILFAIGHFIFLKITLKQNGIKDEVINGKELVSISGAFLAFSLVVTVFYDNWFVRYSIVAIMLLVAYIFRSKILKMLKVISGKG